MNESQLKLLIALHKNNQRQGPGGNEQTLLALKLSGFDTEANLQIADIGCGTGSASLALLKHTASNITAVDFLPEFIEELNQQIGKSPNDTSRLNTVIASMDALPFEKEQFDMIWSEGAIYNMGFKEGIRYWRDFLKPNAKLVLSEITWLTHDRPKEIEDYWLTNYPQIDTAENKIKQLAEAGYLLRGYFSLPTSCWVDNYYLPLATRMSAILQDTHSPFSAELLTQQQQQEREEFLMYQRFGKYYSYGFYIAERSH